MHYFDCIVSSVIWPLLQSERILSEETVGEGGVNSKQGKTVSPWI